MFTRIVRRGNQLPFSIGWSTYYIRCSSVIVDRRTLATWKAVPGFSRYEVSSDGNVRQASSKSLFNINYDYLKRKNKSAAVGLIGDDGKKKFWLLNRLVLSVFNPNIDSSLRACHIDGNKYNNTLSNLAWKTQKDIAKMHAPRTSKRSSVPVQLTLIEKGKVKSVINCDSIQQCLVFVNQFFDHPLQVLQPSKKDTFIDPNEKSHKICTVKYLDESKYTFTVADLNSQEKWKKYGRGKNQTYFVQFWSC